MASLKKLRKVSKKLHWGRGGRYLKHKGKGVKGLHFYTSSQRKELKRNTVKLLNT